MKENRLVKVRDQIQHLLLRHFGVSVDTLYRWGLLDVPAVMEMHCFERSELESYIEFQGGTILDVERYDAQGSAFVSYRYYVTKES